MTLFYNYKLRQRKRFYVVIATCNYIIHNLDNGNNKVLFQIHQDENSITNMSSKGVTNFVGYEYYYKHIRQKNQ